MFLFISIVPLCNILDTDPLYIHTIPYFVGVNTNPLIHSYIGSNPCLPKLHKMLFSFLLSDLFIVSFEWYKTVNVISWRKKEYMNDVSSPFFPLSFPFLSDPMIIRYPWIPGILSQNQVIYNPSVTKYIK